MTLQYAVHCRTRRVATPESMHEQLRAAHHEPLLRRLIDSNSAVQLWQATVDLQWNYFFKYSRATYGGGALPAILPRNTGRWRCADCATARAAVASSSSATTTCDRCDLTEWMLTLYCAMTSAAEPPDAVKLYLKQLLHVKEYPPLLVRPPEIKSLTVAAATGQYEPTTQYQLHNRLYTVTTAFPFGHQARKDTLKFVAANHHWLDMGFHTHSYVPFYISTIEFVFRFGFAFTTAYAGSAVCRVLRATDGPVDDDHGRHVCPRPSECYRCQLVQHWVNHARAVILPDEWELVRSVVWQETVRVFHATPLRTASSSSEQQPASRFSRPFLDVVRAVEGAPAVAVPIASSSSSASAAAHVPLPLPGTPRGLTSVVYDAKIPTVAATGVTAAASVPASVLSAAIAAIQPTAVSKKRKAANDAAEARGPPTDHALPENIRKAIRELDISPRGRVSGKWTCILRFSIDELVRPTLSPTFLRPFWDEYVVETVDRFVREAVLDHTGFSRPWPGPAFTAADVNEYTARKDTIATTATYLERARWACLVHHQQLPNPQLLTFHSLLVHQPRLRLLDSPRYTWETIVQLMPHLPAAFARYKQSDALGHTARWTDVGGDPTLTAL